MDKKPYLLVENSDYDTIYRVLLFDKCVIENEIQDKIYEIKTRFYETGFDDWTIDDVLVVLNDYYEFEDLGDFNYLEV